jgi:hypothetical protein
MDWTIIGWSGFGVVSAAMFLVVLVRTAQGREPRNPHNLTEDAYVSNLGRKNLDD